MKIKRARKRYFVPLFSTADIAFLLLIFIMLVSIINYRKAVDIHYAQAQTAAKTSQENYNLEIWVDIEGNLYLNGENCNIETAEAGIIEAYTEAPDTRVHVIADRDTQFSQVHRVLEILQRLQYRQVSLVVKAP
ncbi:MAG: biopolymer transporter ExbD [Treponema sp.]|nr:biopolymer transporter ExbD [Treponema sp.]